MEKLFVNTIYPAFQGEVNSEGIGAPVIFVRLQGCHLRCYKDTLGSLCDTPEALEGKSGGTWMTVQEILTEVISLREKMGGTSLICLTGGDPLYRSKASLEMLFYLFDRNRFTVSVETSGTLSILPYRNFANVSWVLDYKLKSAGVKASFLHHELRLLTKRDFIKFVVFNQADYEEFKAVLPSLKTHAVISVGTYWGGEISTFKLFNMLLEDKLLGKVTMNVQLHKMAFALEKDWDSLNQIEVPAKI